MYIEYYLRNMFKFLFLLRYIFGEFSWVYEFSFNVKKNFNKYDRKFYIILMNIIKFYIFFEYMY